MRHDYNPHHVNGAFIGILVAGVVAASVTVGLIAAAVFEGWMRVIAPW